MVLEVEEGWEFQRRPTFEWEDGGELYSQRAKRGDRIVYQAFRVRSLPPSTVQDTFLSSTSLTLTQRKRHGKRPHGLRLYRLSPRPPRNLSDAVYDRAEGGGAVGLYDCVSSHFPLSSPIFPLFHYSLY